MALARKPVTVHYRRYVRESGSPTLEQMVHSAMNAHNASVEARVRDRYTLRIQEVEADNFLANIFVDSSAEGHDLAFGDVVHFTKGHMQAVLQMSDQTLSQLAVAQMAAPERSEYVHSQMFWMVKGDHVFVIQSTSLQTEALEKYLAWLLSKYVANWIGNVTLAAKFDSAVVGGDLGDIKEIVIGGALSGPQAPTDEASSSNVADPPQIREVTTTDDLMSRVSSGQEMVRGVLEALLNHDSAAADRVLESVPADAELHVQVHIGYKTRRRKVDRAPLRNLEVGLRHIPDSQLSVFSKGSKTSPDGSVRLHHNASIRLIKSQNGDSEIVGSLLDPHDVLRAMCQAYAVMMADGKIAD
ncbi:hypothetical protein [Alcaligenes sp. SDU_A2]|uniref:hypothetical protein n=1 Tax=Alcaligenes sp. SDU_A2 TaxID=3136634 RepID=UPI00311D4BDB